MTALTGTAAVLLWCASASHAAAQTTAERLIEAGHWKRARAIVEAEARAHPGEPLHDYLLSQIRFAFGDTESPLRLAEQAVRRAPSVGKYHRQLAEVTGVAAQHANPFKLPLLARRFRREIDTAISLDQRDPLALRDLMVFYLSAPGLLGGDAKKAADLAARIAAIDPEEGWLARERVARNPRDPGRSARILDEGARAIPSSYRLRAMAAEAWLAPPIRDLGKAEGHALASLAIDSTRVDAHAVLARVHALRNDWKALETALAAAESAVPDDLTPHYRAAEELLVSGANLALAGRLLRRYCGGEPEGNAPTLLAARRKLGEVTDKLGRVRASVTRGQ